jgi:hypothetical protein
LVVNRAKWAGLTLATLALLDVVVSASPLPDLLEIRLTPLDLAVTFISVLVCLGASVGLWRGNHWGWNFALIYVAIAVLDSARSTVFDPEFELASIGAFGVVLLLYAGILWLIDAERLRAYISPPLPGAGMFSKRLYPAVAQAGLLIVAVSLIGMLWGGIVLVIWLSLMLWAWFRRQRGSSDVQAMSPYNKAMKTDVE